MNLMGLMQRNPMLDQAFGQQRFGEPDPRQFVGFQPQQQFPFAPQTGGGLPMRGVGGQGGHQFDAQQFLRPDMFGPQLGGALTQRPGGLAGMFRLNTPLRMR